MNIKGAPVIQSETFRFHFALMELDGGLSGFQASWLLFSLFNLFFSFCCPFVSKAKSPNMQTCCELTAKMTFYWGHRWHVADVGMRRRRDMWQFWQPGRVAGMEDKSALLTNGMNCKTAICLFWWRCPSADRKSPFSPDVTSHPSCLPVWSHPSLCDLGKHVRGHVGIHHSSLSLSNRHWLCWCKVEVKVSQKSLAVIGKCLKDESECCAEAPPCATWPLRVLILDIFQKLHFSSWTEIVTKCVSERSLSSIRTNLEWRIYRC